MVRIQVGSNTITGGNKWYEVERFEIYKGQYDDGYFFSNDIALIKTTTEIEYVVDEERNMYVVNSICPPQEYIINTDDEYAQFSGFGYMSLDRTNPEFLQKFGGVISYINSQKGHQTHLIDLDLQGAMTCDGDSGSPLIQFDGRKAVIIGLLSSAYPKSAEDWAQYHKGAFFVVPDQILSESPISSATSSKNSFFRTHLKCHFYLFN